MNQFIDKTARWLLRVGAGLTLTSLTALLSADAILRYAFNSPIVGAHDIITFALAVLFATVLPSSISSDAHIRLDLIYQRYGARLKALVDLIGHCVATVFGVLLAYQAVLYVERFYVVGTSTPQLGLPLWPLAVAFSAAGALFALAAVLASARAVTTLAASGR